ncbi:diguanylate cyclase (GGDEF) domain-containing protein [Kaistia soli DSM 19436]|uniref:diguanylate cyclase n=1 Tax=Kaistia soli DSM 19436 TaxID=1122133 RepID=A0A1M5GKR7_9HYPH|nr:GGDEF domain-containing protein [Kaistia soli]SHG04350.1 diguanylate cyclase (GGDEF) domain-containing protein [Kaistia soli DSM 19436]
MLNLRARWIRRRQQIVVSFIAAGTLVFVGLWIFESSAGIILDSDRWAYPIIIAFLCINLLTVAMLPRFQAAAEVACFLAVAFYLLSQIAYLTLGPPEKSIYSIAVALLWMPVLYVGAFMFFSRSRAMVAVGVTFALSAVALVGGTIFTAGRGEAALSGLLVNALVSHFLVLLLLSLVLFLRDEFDRIASHARNMEDAANTDTLTGIANRRALEEWMQRRDAQPSDHRVALVLFDIDHFKAINDRHGHLIGDEVLVSTAQLIRSQMRAHDLVGRWGGEEFLVIIDNADAAVATRLADRVRRLVRVAAHPVAGSVTLSAGLAVCEPAQSIAAIFRAADSALYAAKSGGRNRVVCA